MTSSILSMVSKPKSKPAIITITGHPGIGKTTLAATFPNPIVIRFEDGLESIPEDKRPDAFPLVKSVGQVWDQLSALINEDHHYKTLIVDSVTQAESLFGDHVLANDSKGATSLNTANGGYGAGYGAVSALQGRIRKAAQILNEKKGMQIVFIAHSEVASVDLPDDDPYSRYELRLHKKSAPHYSDNVDMVAYLKLESFTKGDNDDRLKKVISTDQRIAICHTHAAQVSKNRYGIKEPILVNEGENPFIPYIKSLQENQPTNKTQTQTSGE